MDVQLRLVVPNDLLSAVLSVLRGASTAGNLVVLAATAERPSGRVVLCDVDGDEAPFVIADLHDLDVPRVGSIAVHPVDLEVSAASSSGEHPLGRTAVAWEQVEARTSDSTELSASLLAFMALAMVIAAVGIVQHTAILIIAAMILGPDFGPLAGACVAVLERRRGAMARSMLALLGGYAFGFALTAAVFAAIRGVGLIPAKLVESTAHLTPAVSEVTSAPNFFSFLVAGCAAVAGMLSLWTPKSGPLIGVLVSVTTIPAAANAALAVIYGRWTIALGSAEQLAANLATLLLVGVATLAVQRLGFARRRRARRAAATEHH